MNARNPQLEFDDRHLIDLLVDGELDESARRELLLRLDRRPDLWRNCALAFLEAQSWSQTLTRETAGTSDASLASDAARQFETSLSSATSEPVEQPKTRTTISPGFSRVAWVRRASLAASVAMAFGVGAWWGDSQTNRSDQLANSNASSSLGDPSNGMRGNEPVAVPLIESSASDEAMLADLPPPIPPQLIEALEQLGAQVRHQRRLVPFQLEDGRRGVLPLDEIDVQPVAMRSYQ